jgi:UDP-N-acetylglucosamine:LPS N-acetylglucosamine transferase
VSAIPVLRTGRHRRSTSELLLVCSAGGHLLQLQLLDDVWRPHSRIWVTHRREDALSVLQDEEVIFAHGPTTRNVGNMLRNFWLAWKVIRRVRPLVVITTGAGVAVPFAWVGRFHGAKVVYVESLTRVAEPSMSLRLIRPVANRTYVQWPELASSVRGSRYVGNLLGVEP